jgi:hypothetical protein
MDEKIGTMAISFIRRILKDLRRYASTKEEIKGGEKKKI